MAAPARSKRAQGRAGKIDLTIPGDQARRNKLFGEPGTTRHCSAPRRLIARPFEMRCTVLVVMPSDLTTFRIPSKAVLAAPEEARLAGFHPSARTIGARLGSPISCSQMGRARADRPGRPGWQCCPHSSLRSWCAFDCSIKEYKLYSRRRAGKVFPHEIDIQETHPKHRKLDSQGGATSPNVRSTG